MNTLLYIIVAFKSISMTLIGVEKNDTTFFYVNIENKDTAYYIHATNTKGLDTRIWTDTSWRLLRLDKVQPGRVRMKERWLKDHYYVKINNKEKNYRARNPLIDRHVVGYFLAYQRDCKEKRFKMLVPEKGIFPFKSRCKLQDGKRLRTLEIAGLYRALYRKKFYFLFDAQKPLMYKYWDTSKRGLELKEYRIK